MSATGALSKVGSVPFSLSLSWKERGIPFKSEASAV